MGDFFVMPDNESCNSKENNVQVSQPECGLLLTASTILFFLLLSSLTVGLDVVGYRKNILRLESHSHPSVIF